MSDSTRTTLSMHGESDSATFMGVPSLERVSDFEAEIAIFGAPVCTPYLSATEYAHANLEGPTAIRQAVATWAWAHDRFDWDQGECLYVDMNDRVVDLGDLPLKMDTAEQNRALIKRTCEAVFDKGGIPFALGGDDSIPLPVLWAMKGLGDVTVLQIDAHPDWRDEVGGERYGLSSGMRRASEQPYVKQIVQVGMRGLSSAGAREVQDALDWGVKFFPGHEVHEQGLAPILEQIEPGSNVFITIDLDGLDPSIMPAVYVPAPGGLLYWQVVQLIRGVVEKARLRAFAVVELVPARDPEGLGALTAGRIVSNAVGSVLRHGRRR